MKSLLFAAILLVSALTSKTYASDVKVTPSTLLNFNLSFDNVSEVKWSMNGHLYRADFMKDGEKMIAFFDSQDGALLVTSHYMSIKQLPKNLQHSLKAKAGAATINEVYVVNREGEKDYFATITLDGKASVLKAGAKKWCVFHKK